MSATSSSLLVRAKARDPVAWERIAQLYTPLVYRWARQANLQDSDALDVVQEVFQALAGCIDRFQKGGKGTHFRGWLWGITRNKLKDHFRRQASRPQATGGSDAQWQMQEVPEVPVEESQDFDVAGSLANRALALIRTDFSDQTWQAFLRVTLQQQSPADVAADLHMSVASVYQAKSRVLAHLRSELDGLWE